MEVLEKSGNFEFIKVNSASEIDKFKIIEGKEAVILGSGFGYFKGMGIVEYKKAFKGWMRQFPRPILILAVKDREVGAWVYLEEWPQVSRSGESVYVLRAIEVMPKYRRRKLATRLLLLAMKNTVGYIITKPLNSGAEAFFRMNGFKPPSEFSKQPMDLSSHHGYLILSPYKKKELLAKFDFFFM